MTETLPPPGQSLRAMRKALGLTQRQVADHLRLNRTQLAFAEAGTRPVPKPMRQVLADFYRVDALSLQVGVRLLPDGLPDDFTAPPLTPEVAHGVAHFFLIVRNYQRMQRILQRHE